METYYSTLAWRIPWTGDTRLQSMGSQRVGRAELLSRVQLFGTP